MMNPLKNLPLEHALPEASLQLQEAGPEQRSEVVAQLQANNLPTLDLSDAVRLYVLQHENCLIGTAGLEIYGTWALLRSVSITPEGKGRGLGKHLVQQLEVQAKAAGIAALYLVTTTAEGFFKKLGYSRIDRREVPETVAASAQFNGVCPASAAIMVKQL